MDLCKHGWDVEAKPPKKHAWLYDHRCERVLGHDGVHQCRCDAWIAQEKDTTSGKRGRS